MEERERGEGVKKGDEKKKEETEDEEEKGEMRKTK
jgi:hypothetical protein